MRNRTRSKFRSNNEYWKRLRAQIIKVGLPRRDGIFVCVNGCANEGAVSESREIARVEYLGQITSIGSGRALKL